MKNMIYSTIQYIRYHGRILWALLMRELATRYGRDNLGFLWVVGEPLLFTFGVLIMWSIIRPHYDHGIYIVPFIVTGYNPLTLLRHSMGQGLACLSVNSNLLYHRRIGLLHLFIARLGLEFIGCSLSFIVSVTVLCCLGLMDPPKNPFIIYVGWFLLGWTIFGFVLILASISVAIEVFEKFAQLISYIMIPMSGTFYMVFFIPYQYRGVVTKIPLVDCEEMIRSGFFGDAVPHYYDIAYTTAFAAVLSFFGLLMLKIVRDKVEID